MNTPVKWNVRTGMVKNIVWSWLSQRDHYQKNGQDLGVHEHRMHEVENEKVGADYVETNVHFVMHRNTSFAIRSICDGNIKVSVIALIRRASYGPLYCLAFWDDYGWRCVEHSLPGSSNEVQGGVTDVKHSLPMCVFRVRTGRERNFFMRAVEHNIEPCQERMHIYVKRHEKW